MKIPKFLDDLSVISKLGDNPGADNGLTAEGLKAKFDEAGLKLQAFLNDTLIEKINSLFSLDAPPHEGMNMTGPINMNKNKLGGLADPTDGGDAVNLKFANENYRATMDYAKKVGNPHNLLDNSDFRNPVNQRGQDSYSGAGIYAIDRWKIGNTAIAGICTLSDVGITLSAETESNDFEQLLENYGRMKGNKYTIAYKDSNGVVYCLPFTMGGCNGETIGNILFYSVGGRHILFRIPVGLSVTIVWAALYEGEYTAETLPEYQPKGYGAELAECQRYYVAYNFSESFSLGKTYSSNGTKADVQFTTPSDLRLANPTIINELSMCMMTINGTNYSGTLLSATVSGNVVSMIFQSSESMPSNTMCMLRMIGKFALSADLL